MMREQVIKPLPGIPILLFLILVAFAAIALIIYGASQSIPAVALSGVLVLILSIFGLCGLFNVSPNEGKVLQLFGKYIGTVHEAGLAWANPFYSKHAISLRVRNFETSKLKVNDKNGNPIEIAAVVVWHVIDTAEAVFQVDDYQNFVAVQSEAAVRNLATVHPYDDHGRGGMSLVGNTANVSEELKAEVQSRLEKAGVLVNEARISHLAYAPEIAAAMLQRQQAQAVVAARAEIVHGAVSIVESALDELSKKGLLDLDGERKALMVNNLLVVLCGDRHAQPVINAGSLH